MTTHIPHTRYREYSSQPLIRCRECPHCRLPAAVFQASNGRGSGLYRCAHCGRTHDAPPPGLERGTVKGRCEVCGVAVLYSGRGRPRRRCDLHRGRP